MSDLPNGWAWAALDELRADITNALAIGPFGSNLKVADYRGSGVPLIFVRHIRARDFEGLDPKFIDNEKAEQLSAHVVRPGDVVVTKMGDPPGDATVFRGRSTAVLTADCIKVTPHEAIRADYLAYLIEAPQFRSAMRAITQGVAQKKVSLGRFRTLQFPVAPAEEQDRIVAAIDEHLSRLDAADGALRSAMARLQLLESRAVDAAFASLGHRVPTGEVAEVRGGIQKQPKRRPKKNRAPFLRVANVGHGQLALDEVHEVELFEGELERYRLRPGDLLVVEGNGSPAQIGRSAVWRGKIPDCVHQNHLIRVRPGPSLDPEFLGLYWNAPSTRQQLTSVASSTSGLYTLSTSKVRQVEVPVAPLPEQRSTVARLATQLAQFARLRAELRAAVTRNAALRRSILAAAYSGRLVTQDLADEPASVLLDRIQAERAAAAPPKRTKRTRKAKAL
ncbi:MAG: restriction endonuclease subunit S [Acidimicrobiales bacterium]